MKMDENYVFIELGEDAVLAPIAEEAEKSRVLIRLNPTATDIWKRLSEGLSEEQIAIYLVDNYDGIDIEGAKLETHKLIEKLREAGVIQD